MPDAREDLDLPLEAPDAVGVVGVERPQHLQGQRLAARRVLDPEDLPHAPAAQEREHAVPLAEDVPGLHPRRARPAARGRRRRRGGGDRREVGRGVDDLARPAQGARPPRLGVLEAAGVAGAHGRGGTRPMLSGIRPTEPDHHVGTSFQPGEGAEVELPADRLVGRPDDPRFVSDRSFAQQRLAWQRARAAASTRSGIGHRRSVLSSPVEATHRPSGDEGHRDDGPLRAPRAGGVRRRPAVRPGSSRCGRPRQAVASASRRRGLSAFTIPEPPRRGPVRSKSTSSLLVNLPSMTRAVRPSPASRSWPPRNVAPGPDALLRPAGQPPSADAPSPEEQGRLVGEGEVPDAAIVSGARRRIRCGHR